MNHDSVTGLIKKVRKNYYTKSAKIGFIRGNVAADEAVQLDPGRRLFVGYSKRGKNDYRLELRVQREGSLAYEAAQDFKKQAKGEANICVVERISVPSISIGLSTESYNSVGQAQRPLHIGVSVGHKNSGPGTLGAFVGTANGDAILSNCHVLALSGRIDPQDVNAPHYIYQPGKPDVHYLRGQYRVAQVDDLIDISSAVANKVDAAVAVLLPDVANDHLGNTVPPGNWPKVGETIGPVTNPLKLKENSTVTKIGRTTGYTTGAVTATSTDAIVDIPGLGNVYFEDLLEVTAPLDSPFSAPGDSGSLVFESDSLAAVGLHFAGGEVTIEGRRMQASYACSLENVEKALGFTWLI